MNKPSMLDSKELMDYFMAKYGSGDIDIQPILEMENGDDEYRKAMNSKARNQHAKASEELRKFRF